MFIKANGGIFVNTYEVSALVLTSEMSEIGGERWFIKAYGYFNLPSQHLLWDVDEKTLDFSGYVLIGPFTSKSEAENWIFSLDEEIYFEAQE